MDLPKLEIDDRLFWTNQSLSEYLGISEESTRVLCSRYTKKGLFIRLRSNMYLLRSKISRLVQEDFFYLSNLLQTPSYISFMTALSSQNITTQITRGVIESVSPVRSKEYLVESQFFSYHKIDPDLYFGFERIGRFFIAKKEKAFLDCLYFKSLNRYSLDITSIDIKKLLLPILKKMAKRFPDKTQDLLNKTLKDAGIKTA